MALFAVSANAQSNLETKPEPVRRFELTWLVPAGCPSREAVLREVDELIADSAKTQPSATLLANGTVVSAQDGFSLTLTLKDAETSRSRQLDAPTCEELEHAAALVVAIAIDPTLLTRRKNPDDAKAAALFAFTPEAADRAWSTAPQPPSVVPPPSSPTDVPAPALTKPNFDANAPLFYRLGFGLVGGFGVLPQTAVGPSVFGALQGKTLRLELAASRLTAEAHAHDTVGRGANFDLYRLAPRSCWLVADTAWSAGPCVSVELGVITGKGYGLPSLHRKTAPWFGSAIGGLFEWRVAQSSLLGVSADLGIPLRHDRFELAYELLYRPEISGSVSASLSAGWR